MSRRTRALALAGSVAAGAALARRRRAGVASPLPEVAVPPPPPLQGRLQTVTTPDGVDLHVEVHGPSSDGRDTGAVDTGATDTGATDTGARDTGAVDPDATDTGATGTVVLLHGYVQSSRLWAGQVRDLVAARPDLRVVTYDHRGHGRSAATARKHARLEQLARDLAQVLDEVAPTGPVVVGGHSMGGMTIMALAEQRPELFGDRVVGVALVGTSSGQLDAVTYGLPAPVATVVKAVLPRAYEKAVRDEARGRTRPSTAFERRLVFPRGADPEHVREVLAVQAECTAETMAAFLPTFSEHDRAQALSALAEVPVLVVAGDKDLLCPLPHSHAIAEALPQAELVVYPGVGHMVHLERREEVSRRLVSLVAATLPARERVTA